MTIKSLLPFLAACLSFAQSNTTIGLTLTGKSGPQNARVWDANFINSGPDTALGAQVDSFTLAQVTGTSCIPVVNTTFPIVLGDIGPGYATVPYSVVIDFTGCPANARFTMIQTLEANSGQTTATVPRYNQYR